MADKSLGKKKTRIRKAPTTVRQQIEVTAKQAESRPKKDPSSARGFFSEISSGLKSLVSPLAPVWRLLKRVLGWFMPRYFINSWRELRQVAWPNRKETWRLTGAVFIFAVVFGALVAVVDKGLDEFFKKVILKQ